MKIIKKINYILDRKTKAKAIVVLIMTCIGAALELAGVSIILPLVNIGMGQENAQDNSICKIIMDITGILNPTKVLMLLVLLMIFIYIVKNIYMAYMNCIIFHFSMNVRRKLATKLMTSYLKQPYSFFLNKNSSELIRSINTDTAQFYEMLSNCFLVASNGLVAVSLVIYLSITNFLMTFVVVVVLGLFAGTVFIKIRNWTRNLGERNQTMTAQLLKMLQQSLDGVKEIKVLGREKYFINNYDTAYQESANITRKFNLGNLLPKYLIEMVCMTAVLGFLEISIMSTGTLDVLPKIAIFAVACFKLLPSVNALYAYSNTIVYNMASVDLIYNDLQEAEHIENDAKKCECIEVNDKETTIDFKEYIDVRNVTFAYANTSKNILDNISLTIRKGQSVAFIGPSGGGKTTLADIVLGLLSPVSGEVLVDGINIAGQRSSWTNNIGYIPQSIYLTDDTIRNNVAFGIPEKDIDDKRVWKVLEDAQLKEFVENSEKGLDTMVGEHGVRISGGQRQRIGISRALYSNPAVLLFDEATSALDNETEYEVMQAIDALHGAKTIIMIAHRLSTIRNCDDVYEVGDGNVIKKGCRK